MGKRLPIRDFPFAAARRFYWLAPSLVTVWLHEAVSSGILVAWDRRRPNQTIEADDKASKQKFRLKFADITYPTVELQVVHEAGVGYDS